MRLLQILTRRLLPVAAAFLAALSMSAAAQSGAVEEGKEYLRLKNPQPVESGKKIEVIEFFSYGCPHCAEFYPLVSTWVATQPKDVVFRRVPVGFNRPAWINLQRTYFALQASGDLDRLDAKLFQALHEQRLPLYEEPAIAEWVGKNGGDAQKFAAAYTSFGINNLTVEADKMSEDYQVTGIPTMAVAGKYIALGDTFTLLLANTDKLIAKVRAEAKAPHPKK